MGIQVKTITVKYRWDWVAGSLGSSPQWGKEDPPSLVSLSGPEEAVSTCQVFFFFLNDKR